MIPGTDTSPECFVALQAGVASTEFAHGPPFSWIQAPELCALHHIMAFMVVHRACPEAPVVLTRMGIVLVLLGSLPVVQGSCVPSRQEWGLDGNRRRTLGNGGSVGVLIVFGGGVGGALIAVGGRRLGGSRNVGGLLLVA